MRPLLGVGFALLLFVGDELGASLLGDGFLSVSLGGSFGGIECAPIQISHVNHGPTLGRDAGAKLYPVVWSLVQPLPRVPRARTKQLTVQLASAQGGRYRGQHLRNAER